MSELRILHLMNGFADASIGRIVQRLISSLGTHDYFWVVASLTEGGELVDVFRKMDVSVIEFGGTTQPDSDGRSIYHRISREIERLGIDLVHTHTMRTILTAGYCLGWNSPVIHLATKHTLTRPGQRRYGSFYTLADLATLYIPTHLVAVSAVMRDQIARMPGLPKGKISVIQNMIDCSSYYVPQMRSDCRQELEISPDCILVGFSGRIVQAKRLDLLLTGFSRALSACPGINARLVIIGEGDLRPSLEDLSQQLGISQHVIWTGFRTDTPRLLAGIDIYVQSSINEGLSLSLLEAMAAAKPVIATDVGGTGEVVTDGVTGLLIPGGSVEAIALALKNLFTNQDLRENLASAGQNFVKASFDYSIMAQSYGQLYKQLCPAKLSSNVRLSVLP